MDTYLVKNQSGQLKPVDDESKAVIDKLKKGQIYKCKITKARDYEYHKKFFDFLTTTFGMQEHFETFEHYRRWITMKSGYYTSIVAPNGNVIFTADSISFDKMEEDDFHKLFSTCIDVYLKELGKGITQDELLRVVDYA